MDYLELEQVLRYLCKLMHFQSSLLICKIIFFFLDDNGIDNDSGCYKI